MRFLVINTDYPAFLEWLYGTHPGLSQESHERQMAVHAQSAFGVSAIYTKYLRRLGHSAIEVHANNPFAQAAWAEENGIRLKPWRRWGVRMRKGLVPWPHRSSEWLGDVLGAQIEEFAPDVVINLDVRAFDSRFFAPLRGHFRMLVGQHAAAALPDDGDWSGYDLTVSSLQSIVEWFRLKGVPAEQHKLAFDTDILEVVGSPDRDIPVSFVGSFFGVHQRRLEFLESVCSLVDVGVWGLRTEEMDAYPHVQGAYRGPAWGLDMYRVLARSKITLNHHADFGLLANNFRLYEATGMGAMLITDWKQDLGELFTEGREVAAYRTAKECAEVIQNYLESDDERVAVARAGQQRTIKDHNYADRMRELTEIIETRL